MALAYLGHAQEERSSSSNVSFIPGTGTGRGQGAGAVGITYPSYLGQEQEEGREQEQ